MTPNSDDPVHDDHDVHDADPIGDLGNAITIGDATQVKGGFDPQPDPPRVFNPGVISSKVIKF
jgi:hypothetical protein